MQLDKLKYESKIRISQYIIHGIISYLVIAIQEDKLNIFNKFLNTSVAEYISENTLTIVICLASISCIFEFIIIPLKNKNRLEKDLCNAICRRIYKYIQTKLKKDDFNQNIRVTIFKAGRNECIKAIGRYAINSPKKKIKVKFKLGEGVAGICFGNRQIMNEHLPDFNSESEKYYSVSYNKYKLSKKQVDKLNKKSCEILCIPIKSSNGDSTWGVLSIDSEKKKDKFNMTTKKINKATKKEENASAIAREIEKVIENYEILFEKDEK